MGGRRKTGMDGKQKTEGRSQEKEERGERRQKEWKEEMEGR